MEGVAARARCGKGSLYRRWRDKRELILAALRSQFPPLPSAQCELPARQNLFSALRSLAEVLTGNASYPELLVVVGLFRDAEIRCLYAELVVARSMTVLESIILAGICSGEIAPASVTALAPRIGPALIVEHVLLRGTAPTASEIEGIIDAVIGRTADTRFDSRGERSGLSRR